MSLHVFAHAAVELPEMSCQVHDWRNALMQCVCRVEFGPIQADTHGKNRSNPRPLATFTVGTVWEWGRASRATHFQAVVTVNFAKGRELCLFFPWVSAWVGQNSTQHKHRAIFDQAHAKSWSALQPCKSRKNPDAKLATLPLSLRTLFVLSFGRVERAVPYAS